VNIRLKTHAERLGPPQTCDGPDHPRRVLANNVGYFQTHRHHPNTASAKGIRAHTSAAYPSMGVSLQAVPAGHPDRLLQEASDGGRCLQQWSADPIYNCANHCDNA